MKLLSSIVLLLALDACHGAALVRFINTVPGTNDHTSPNYHSITANWAAPTAPTTPPSDPEPNFRLQRIGLQYNARNAQGGLEERQVVWTQTNTGASPDAATTTAPYYYENGMPGLRPYHKPRTLTREDVATARVANSDQTTAATDNGGLAVMNSDVYNQAQLKADGVGLFLSFAAGTYTMRAYGVLGNAQKTVAFSNTAQEFENSERDLTFEDGKVYTLIACGDAKWTTTGADTSTATVSLTLFEESVSATTFGKGSLRFINAIQTQATNSISVYRESVNAAEPPLASVPFLQASEYSDAAPGVTTFPIAIDSGDDVKVLATDTRVQYDIRAGMRATVICANADSTNPNYVFCRPIPSRVVAYVRLGHDAAGYNALVMGRFGPQKISQTTISLWASVEFPLPQIAESMSTLMGQSIVTGTMVSTNGLYPVVTDVTAGSVSDYGEVFVPLYIMDMAIRPLVLDSQTGTNHDFLAARNWYPYAPRFKRVNLIIKTDGFATIQPVAEEKAGPTPTGALPTNNNYEVFAPQPNLQFAATVDRYMEPGAYYTYFLHPGVTTAVALPRTPLNGVGDAFTYQTGSNFMVGYTVDQTVDEARQYAAMTSKAVLRLQPIYLQKWDDTAGQASFKADQTGNSGVSIEVATNLASHACNSYTLTTANAADNAAQYTNSILANTDCSG
eukprot:CAMPEP_0175826518 /NCGR_PEP_ID=MMETSP0107_2-20121207/11807_1 /TAXON_ID=195067 ORGANISM="Goniomonas pacifica, Strain CCMP1869" /NCGR_SAMPLE_ID=MMETSP0107_2 /ASSEMBLY_ACC=CAM_ASM_000203 /LENGTH=676 /DNA_ID=CAMNT_0017139161 /DNA_START=82 /DNA_END=2109 /DNA_ORIENTATION=+